MTFPSPVAYQQLMGGISEILFSAEQIQARVLELGAAVSRDYEGSHPLLAIWEELTASDDSLERLTALFPLRLLEMVRIGEHTGDLSGTLRRTADRIEDDVQAYRVKQAIAPVWKLAIWL